jgi:hypothetical protein
MSLRLLAAYTIVTQIFASAPTWAINSKSTHNTPAITLLAWPSRVNARYGDAIWINTEIKNVTTGNVYVANDLRAVPFGLDTSEGCLMMRCRNKASGKEVTYHWHPNSFTTQDNIGVEQAVKLTPGYFSGTTLNLQELCDLPPGSYIVELQYQTSNIRSGVRPDKRAWHGTTNKVEVAVDVSRPWWHPW